MELTQEILKELMTYNPDTGICLWNERDDKWFTKGKKQSAQHKANVFNSQKAFGPVGWVDPDCGYQRTFLFGKFYQVHRLIWLYMTGEWPDQVDHKNGVRDDNRWCNLQNVKSADNHKNKGKNSRNTSGYKGVSLVAKTGEWAAFIKIDGKSKFLGSSPCPQKAFRLYVNEARKLGFSERHIFGKS